VNFVDTWRCSYWYM